jgi:hypothetical protein
MASKESVQSSFAFFDHYPICPNRRLRSPARAKCAQMHRESGFAKPFEGGATLRWASQPSVSGGANAYSRIERKVFAQDVID